MKKKIFTLFAFLAMFMGANAANWVQVADLSFGQFTGYPHYVMGYVPEFLGDGVMTDMGGQFTYKTDDEMTSYEFKEGESEVGTVATQAGVTYHKIQGTGTWHQYFVITGFNTQLDGHYRVVAKVKASETCEIPMQMRWAWNDASVVSTTASAGTDWAEIEWEYTGINGTKCDLIAQPNTQAQIQWEWIKVYEDQAEQRPITWQEWLTNDGKSIVPGQATNSKYVGDAETPWTDPSVKFNDQTQNYLICAWGKERMVNVNADGGWDPFPATIEAEEGNPSNHVFVVHGKAATSEGDPAAWDNQFWIESPKSWKAGEQVKISFKYKASKNVKTGTQIHHQNPSDYMTWQGVGDVAFTTEWQTFETTYTWPSDGARDDDTGWSLCFNLNSTDKEAIDFYFDDLSWQSMVLDEGWFVASSNTSTGLQYNFDNAIEFEVVDRDDEGNPTLVATVGTPGDQSSWVNEVMISTVRGNDAAFKGATIKPEGTVKDDPDDWPNYDLGTNAKIKLPAAGVWQITIVTGFKALNFVKLEGEANKEPVAIVTNATESVVHGTERDWKPAKDDGSPQDGEEGVGTGQPWDNQFWIAANRDLSAGEVTTVKFKYKASTAARTSTQAHKVGDDGKPCTYLNWQAIGDVNFTEEWQDFETTFTVPDGDDGMRSIVFNMAEIKGACDYYIKDVQWYLKDDALEAEGKTMENLIDAEGDANFWIKEDKGAPEQASGISAVVSDKKATNVTYNLAGQRVSKGYKGIVIKNGSKYIVK